MGNKNTIKEIIIKIGWWIYWKAKWQKNLEWKENFSPKNTLGRQIRDNLAYFILYGLDEKRNYKTSGTINDLLTDIHKLCGIEILNNDDTITTLLDRKIVIKTITNYVNIITDRIELNEFPRGKEMYCPKCYFDNNKEILKVDCDGHKK